MSHQKRASTEPDLSDAEAAIIGALLVVGFGAWTLLMLRALDILTRL